MEHCKNCNREQKMFWRDAEHKNRHSEMFYTYKGKQGYCAECIELLQGTKPLTLTELNNKRKYEKMQAL